MRVAIMSIDRTDSEWASSGVCWAKQVADNGVGGSVMWVSSDMTGAGGR